jgi:hypothetical protein
VRELHTVPDRPAPGPFAGGLLGVPAGLLLAWLWVDRDPAVALAVSLVFAGLVASIAAGAPAWRRFAIGMLSTAVLTVVVLVWLGTGLGG